MTTALDDFPTNIDDEGVVTTSVRAPKKPKHVTPQEKQKGEPRIKIILDDNENIPPSGQFVSVDGVGYLIPTGVPVEVPQSVLNVLDDAIMSVPVVDKDTKQVVGFKDRLRFGYRIVHERSKG